MRALGIALLGLSVGLQYGLLAVGLVLIYRASRFVSFVQGQLGIFAAIVLGRLAIEAHVPYAAALAAGLVAAALTSVLIERAVIQRLFRSSRLVLMVATIALTQGLFAATQFKGFHFGSATVVPPSPLRLDQAIVVNAGGFPVPFRRSLDVGGVVLDSAQLLTLVVAPLIVVALYLVFARTKLGRSIRAASSNPEAARLAGISVRRVSLIVWIVAGVLSGLAAVLGAPSQPTITGSLLGPGLLLRGVAAAMLAGFLDFRIAFCGGIVVGVVEQVAQYNLRWPGVTDLSVLVVLAIGLAWRGRALAASYRRGDDVLTIERSRPDTGGAHRLATSLNSIGWVGLIAVLAVLPFLPGLQTEAKAQALTQLLSIAICGLSLTVLTGWTGQISLGHFALLGVGAFVTAQTLAQHGWAFPIVFLVAGAASAGVALLVGLPATWFRGLFLAVTTLALAVLGPSWLFNQRILGSDDGRAQLQLSDVHWPLGGHLGSYRELYGLALVVLVLAVIGLRSLRRSSVGRAFVAVRDNERAATAAGISAPGTKAVALLLSGFLAGIAGSLWAMSQSIFGAPAFDAGQSLTMLSVAIVGGLGSLVGPIIGTFAVFGFPSLVDGQNNIVVRSLFSTTLLLAVLIFLPGGFASLLHRARDRIAVRRGDRSTLAGDLDDADAGEGRAGTDAVVRLPASGRAWAPIAGADPLVVEGVNVRFGGLQALRDVSIRIGAGEIVGLIGGNGAGKSTLMDCISGHREADSGDVVVFGRDVGRLPPQFRRELGVARTFQDAALYPGLDVRESVTLPLDYADRSGPVGALVAAPWVAAAEARKAATAGRVLRRLGLDSRASSLTGDLSTGTRRLVDLAAVIAGSPGLVLLDEPTAGIAQREVEEFGPLLRRVVEELGCAVLLIEHDMPLVMGLCDRVYCLESGHVIAEGTPSQVQHDPAVIASYLGTDTVAVARSGAGS